MGQTPTQAGAGGGRPSPTTPVPPPKSPDSSTVNLTVMDEGINRTISTFAQVLN